MNLGLERFKVGCFPDFSYWVNISWTFLDRHYVCRLHDPCLGLMPTFVKKTSSFLFFLCLFSFVSFSFASFFFCVFFSFASLFLSSLFFFCVFFSFASFFSLASFILLRLFFFCVYFSFSSFYYGFDHFEHLEFIIDSCASPSDNPISLRYSMPAFSANSFGLFFKCRKLHDHQLTIQQGLSEDQKIKASVYMDFLENSQNSHRINSRYQRCKKKNLHSCYFYLFIR